MGNYRLVISQVVSRVHICLGLGEAQKPGRVAVRTNAFEVFSGEILSSSREDLRNFLRHPCPGMAIPWDDSNGRGDTLWSKRFLTG